MACQPSGMRQSHPDRGRRHAMRDAPKAFIASKSTEALALCAVCWCRSGVRIAIVGPPNAGKSSLLNLLAGHEAAIVSPVAGTTRDVVQVQLELAGIKVIGLAG